MNVSPYTTLPNALADEDGRLCHNLGTKQSNYYSLVPPFPARQEFLEYGCAGAYSLPKNPEVMYKDSWQGWDDFLGVMRSFEEARGLSRGLGLKSEEEWEALLDKVAPQEHR